jgi:hypothetical protein
MCSWSAAEKLLKKWSLEMELSNIPLLYLGPETIMPLGSFLAAAVGLLLVFWRQTTLFLRSAFRRVLGRKSSYPTTLDSQKPGQEHRSSGAD